MGLLALLHMAPNSCLYMYTTSVALNRRLVQGRVSSIRYLERMPVTLSEAKGLARRAERSFASLRMTARTPLQSASGKPSLQISADSRDQWQTAKVCAIMR